MASRHNFLPDSIRSYIAEHSVREHPLLAELRAETSRLPNAGMQISADQGQFMALLARLIHARRCIEVGVFTGYSSLAVARALPDDGQMVCCDVSEEWTTIARRYWERAGVAGKISLRLGPATETLDAMLAAGEAGRYDFVFIDADKTNYLDYYERCLALLRTGGLIAVDNTLWSGAVADAADQTADTVALREFNDRVHRDERVELSLTPIGDGLTLLAKR
jgi:predicted O-methyltransferase YrrM